MNRTVEEKLVGIGNLMEAARRKTQSLSPAERRMIERTYSDAIAHGYGWNGINSLVMEGERGRRGLMPMPLIAKYIGTQDGGPLGVSFRMYNIEGDHPLNNSTVGVMTLIHNGIIPLDISLARISYEYTKEQILMAYWYALNIWQVIKIKMGVDHDQM